MRVLAAAAALILMAMFHAVHGQSPAGAPQPAESARKVDAELAWLRREVERLSKQVEALTRTVTDLTNQLVTALQISTVTDYFGGQSGLQPKVIASYPGRLVSANVTLVRTERDDAGTFTIDRSVVITPGGSAAIPVEGADVICNWVVYDEANAIRVRSEGCSYLARGLRGHFTGAAYYRR